MFELDVAAGGVVLVPAVPTEGTEKLGGGEARSARAHRDRVNLWGCVADPGRGWNHGLK